MADDYSEAIADAHEAGNSQLAHELIAEQHEAEAGGESESEKPAPVQDSGPSDPIPVEHTDVVYAQIRSEFGEDEAFLLQNAWGDNAVAKDAIVGSFLKDSPAIGNLYEQHQTDSGGLTLEGVQAVYRHLLDNSDYANSEVMDRAHPELTALYNDYADESGAIGIAGVKVILAYVAQKSGFEHVYRAKR